LLLLSIATLRRTITFLGVKTPIIGCMEIVICAPSQSLYEGRGHKHDGIHEHASSVSHGAWRKAEAPQQGSDGHNPWSAGYQVQPVGQPSWLMACRLLWWCPWPHPMHVPGHLRRPARDATFVGDDSFSARMTLTVDAVDTMLKDSIEVGKKISDLG
jgi:hypothetical protein